MRSWRRFENKGKTTKVSAPALAVLASLALTSCQSSPALPSSPAELSSSLSTSQSVLSNAIQYSPSEMVLTGRSGPYWALVGFNTQTHQTQFITPPGVSTRGGIAVAANGDGYLVAGVHAYQSMLLSPIFVSSTVGKTWSTAELGFPMAPITSPIAVTSRGIYVAVAKKNGSDSVVRASLPLQGGFSAVPTPPGMYKVEDLLGFGSGVIAIYRGSGSSTTYEASYSSSSGTWTSYGTVSPLLRGVTLLTSSGEVAATCTPSGSSSDSEVVTTRVFGDGYNPSSPIVQTTNVVPSQFIGCTPSQVQPLVAISILSKGSDGHIDITELPRAGSNAPLESFSVPAVSMSNVLPVSFGSDLFLYSGTPNQVELRDLSARSNFSGTINGVLAYVFKQTRAN
ncbi:hypothetical protein [Ferrithrix thermotolerans]|uniref:hypothetical protein n=1 Tax=Ferrithrix thermotolerans TaxID=209649 RepID=UPI00116050CA|nr:hypothetical protein [Ferrithrix thermotolerans]